ncbi:MAG TPA: hypothetical protein VG095_06935 [Chthoniobacterales bacterium]|nr:hypothetical protein [Chthoniobacterales bacterium]
MKTPFAPSFVIVSCAVSFLAACQTTKETIPNRFTDADLNRDESLSRTEVAAYFSDIMFDAADANKDGNLTLAEWASYGSASRPAELRAADANSDGTVTREEARTYARRRPMTEAFMKGADTNKDGSLSREEATAYYASREGPVR